MRKDSLPSPGPLSMGVQLHACVAKAISAIEIASVGGGGKAPYAKRLDDFFTAARTAIAGYIDAVAPTIAARISGGYADADNADGSTAVPNAVVRIRANKQLDPAYVPQTTAFAVASPAVAVTRVAIDGPDIVLTLARALTQAEGATVTTAYTQPGAATNARDLSGNLLASAVAAAATSNLVV